MWTGQGPSTHLLIRPAAGRTITPRRLSLPHSGSAAARVPALVKPPILQSPLRRLLHAATRPAAEAACRGRASRRSAGQF